VTMGLLTGTATWRRIAWPSKPYTPTYAAPFRAQNDDQTLRTSSSFWWQPSHSARTGRLTTCRSTRCPLLSPRRAGRACPSCTGWTITAGFGLDAIRAWVEDQRAIEDYE